MARWAPRAIGIGLAILVIAAFGFRLHSRHHGSVRGLELPSGTPIRYTVAWSWDGARWEDTRHAWVFRTDRGYTVWLQAGYLGIATLEVVPCRPPVPPHTAALMLRGLLEPAEAEASHLYIHDKSLATGRLVDSILEKGTRVFGDATASGKPYCQLHELLAPLDQKADDGFHLDHWSAFIRGGYSLPDGTEHPFEAHVNLMGGAIVDLNASVSPGHPGGPVEVRVTRSVVHAFDNVAMEKLSPSELAYAFMRGLTKGTRAEYQF